MRTLLLMQGCPASAKTSWIRDNKLEQYTLSADELRTYVQAPVLNEEGKLAISQNNDKYVWDLLMKLLEDRMKKGDFTVIDATHNNDKMLKRYKDLCDTYKYTMFIKRMDTPLEQCLINNRNRDEYKFVPEDKIKLMYDRIQNMKQLSWYNYIDKIEEINNFYTIDMNKYEKIFILGDIHGCIEPLEEFFKKHTFSEKYAYVFLGDFIDRGVDSLKVMDKMIVLSKHSNVYLLEGNHENVLLPFSRGVESGKRSFDRYTAKELQSLNKKEVKLFYKKLRQCMRFTYNDKEYFLCHGGISANPKHLTYISTHQLIKGVGNYEYDVDKMWFENESNVIQIHGHRSYNDYPNSISLEGEVEFGGYLKYIELVGTELNKYEIKNNKFKLEKEIAEMDDSRKGLSTPNEVINSMSKNRMIKCKNLDNNIVSLNFTENCFRKKAWNDMTVKARGLFVDKTTGKIVSRGYEKFFNHNESKETTLGYIKNNYIFPLTSYTKYNGYLGIISHLNNELVFYTKSTNLGEKAERFKEIFYKYTTKEYQDKLLDILQKNDCSLTCEVIDMDYDPHIIDEKPSECIYYLDLIKNDLEYQNLQAIYMSEIFLNLNRMYTLYNTSHIAVKHLDKIITTKEDLEDYIKEADRREIEGFVIHSHDNKQIFKLKTKFYNEWKSCRYLMNQIKKNNGYFEIRLSNSPLQVQFGKWYSDNFKELKDINSIIELRKLFNKER